MPESSFSDAEWKCLMKAQNSLEEEEEVVLAKLLCLQKQKWLLQKHAGDFIARNIKEIKELEDLEEKECNACEEQEALQKQQEKAAAEMQQLAAVSEDPSLIQMLNSPSFWNDLDLSAGNLALPGGNPSNL